MKNAALKRLAVAGIVIAACIASTAQEMNFRVDEIDRGTSWVSSYWGYSAPKIVNDGDAYYTLGLWGEKPEAADAVIYKCTGGKWEKGRSFPGVYQPGSLLVDKARRLIAVLSRSDKPALFFRSRGHGDITGFDELAPPPDMPNAYYIGTAIRDEVLYVAYIVTPTYTMRLTTLNLETLQWTPSVVVAEGQIEHKPKTAWTYPILCPDEKGLHLVASNCPDGGDGNTYNIVWYLFYPRGEQAPSIREKVGESPIGSNAYATDMLVDAKGTVHVVHMWNHRKYGDALPAGSEPEGMYHAWRDAVTGSWRHTQIAPVCIAGLSQTGDRLTCLTQESGNIVNLIWNETTQSWGDSAVICAAAQALAPLSFMDVIQSASGSDCSKDVAIVVSGVVPPDSEQVIWSLLPK